MQSSPARRLWARLIFLLSSAWFLMLFYLVYQTLTDKAQTKAFPETVAKMETWHKGDLLQFTNGHVAVFILEDGQSVTITDGSDWYRSSAKHVLPRLARVVSTNQPGYAELSVAFVRQQFERPTPGMPR